MQIAEKIWNERKRLGLSQEQLAEQMEVSRQAVSKWESGQSMPDLDKLVLLSQIFGVSTDYLLKEDDNPFYEGENTRYPEGKNNPFPGAAHKQPSEQSEIYGTSGEKIPMEQSKAKTLDTEQIRNYQSACFKSSQKIALGVSLCIIGVILYLSTNIYIQAYAVAESGEAAIVLLLCVAPAVALFISAGMKMEQFRYLKTDPFQLTEISLKQLKEEYDKYFHTFMIKITTGVILCIFAVITYLATNLIVKHRQDIPCIEIIPTVSLLSIVTVAVYLFVSAGICKDCYDVLLQQNDYTHQKKKRKKGDLLETVAGIYWCVVTAGFLGYNLITHNWGISWVVWPVAGCLFGAISVLLEFIQQHRK